LLWSLFTFWILFVSIDPRHKHLNATSKPGNPACIFGKIEFFQKTTAPAMHRDFRQEICATLGPNSMKPPPDETNLSSEGGLFMMNGAGCPLIV
jgi:hypothetical protein